MSTLQDLNDSARLLRAGRHVQRRIDCRLIDALIRELNDKVRAEGDIDSARIIEELNSLRDRIAATNATE